MVELSDFVRDAVGSVEFVTVGQCVSSRGTQAISDMYLLK